MDKKITLIIFKVILASIFLYAAISKIPDPVAFAKNIEAYQMTPHKANHWIALYLPALEIVLCIAIFIPQFAKSAFYLLVCLTLVFLTALSYAWATGKDIDCGCFGGESKVNGFKIFMDIVLLLFIMATIWLENKVAMNKKNSHNKDTQ